MSDLLDQLAAEELRRVRRRRLFSLIGLAAAAATGIVVIEQCAETGRACVERVRDEIRAEQKGMPIAALQGTFDELRAEFRRRVEDCEK